MKIKIHFYKGRWFFWKLISWKTSSKYTHTSIELNNTVYESITKWVVKSKNPSFYNYMTEYDTIYIDVTEEQLITIKTFLEEQIWKKYDNAWIAWILFLEYFQNPNKWYCSELVFECLRKINYTKYNNHWITPWWLYFWLLMKEEK